jgi:outer membrane protein OmpA-like peptidoglycan-associated protein
MFMIVGHTDTVGSDRYNNALSLRRARAVKNELINLGIPASRIKSEGRGFHQLMVITPHGVKEPKNRRAEICYSKY